MSRTPIPDYLIHDAETVARMDREFNKPKDGWKTGLLFRWSSFWIGCHWSPKHKRACINFLSCITWWITLPGGEVPTKEY